MLISLHKRAPNPTLADTGLSQQMEIFEQIRGDTGRVPPVVDAADILRNPAETLGHLCERVGVTFDPNMLRWDKGARKTDGVWGKYWYESLYDSCGFQGSSRQSASLPEELNGVYQEAMPLFETLSRERIQ